MRPGDPRSEDLPLLRTGVVAQPRWNRQDSLLVAALALAAVAVRLPGLDHGLWIDEIHTLVSTVHLPPGEIIRRVHGLNNHVLYSLSAHFSIAAFGDSIWALRLPAVLFGVAAVPAAYYLGRQISSRPEAFLAALFLALNYQHVWFSQNARGYTALLLGAVAGTAIFIRLVGTRKPPVPLIAAYAAVAALSTSAHLTAVAVLFAHGLTWLGLALGRVGRGWSATVLPSLAALFFAGVLVLALNALTLSGHFEVLFKNWTVPAAVPSAAGEPGGAGPPFESAEERSASQVLGGAQWTLAEFAEGLGRSLPGGGLAIVAVLAVLAAGVISFARQGHAVLALLLLPPLITLLAIAASSLFVFPRFFFNSLVFFILLGVRGGFAFAAVCLPFLSRRLVVAAGIAVALAGAATLPAAWRPKQDWPAVVEYLAARRAPDDALACLGTSPQMAIHDYLETACELVNNAAQLESLERNHPRVWLVYTVPAFSARSFPNVFARLRGPGAYRLMHTEESTVSGGDIIVMLGPGAGERP